LYAQLPLADVNTGVGIALDQQEAGPFQRTNVQLNYAYHMQLGGGQLSLGIAGQFGAFTYDPADQVLAEASDPLAISDRSNTTVFNVGGGLFYPSVEPDDFLERVWDLFLMAKMSRIWFSQSLF
jgi:hypothetical protein